MKFSSATMPKWRRARSHGLWLFCLALPFLSLRLDAEQRGIILRTGVPQKQSPSCCSSNAADNNLEEMFATAWKKPGERQPLKLSHRLTRQDGKEIDLHDLANSPLVVSFIYTRCVNTNKCEAVTRGMARLRQQLRSRHLLDKIKLVLISYDPVGDTPEKLRQYAKDLGLDADENTLLLRTKSEDAHQLYDDLGVQASFNGPQVTLHGIQLLLIDPQGRLARTYRTILWRDSEVIADLEKLLSESSTAKISASSK
jgi:protein SCO1/2